MSRSIAISILILCVEVCASGYSQANAALTQNELPPIAAATTASSDGSAWETPARMRKLIGSQPGMLRIDHEGVRFVSQSGKEYLWHYLDIDTFGLETRTLSFHSYQNNDLHRPGTKWFRFEFQRSMPPSVAGELAKWVAKPARNGDPDPKLESFASIPVRYRSNFGGTNGTLRFGDGGIEYVTTGKDARSWRWSDLNTITSPDPYHLFVFGYRDTYAFDLKAPLSQALFNRLTDAIYSHNTAAITKQRPHVQAFKGGLNSGRGVGHE